MTDIVPVDENKPVAQKEPTAVKHQVKGKMYSAGSKSEPDAWLAQKWANDRGVSTELVEAEQTKDYVQVITRAINPRTGQYVEDIIRHDFNTIFLKKAIDLVDKSMKYAKSGQKKTIFIEDLAEPLIITESGDMVPNLTPRGKLKLMKEMVNFKNFAIRDATSKSMRRAMLKILNYDWREDEEIDMEQEEVEQVQKMIKEQNTSKKKQSKPPETKKNPEELGFNPDTYEEEIKGDTVIPELENDKKEEEKLSERKEAIKTATGTKKDEEKKRSKGKKTEGTKGNKTENTNTTKVINEKTKDLPDDELKINILLNTLRDRLFEEKKELNPLNMLRIADKHYKEDSITKEQFTRVKQRIKDGTFDV